MCDKPIAAGKSSFDLIDFDKLVDGLKIEGGKRFLDLACGAGRYALALVDHLGSNGVIYAVDLWKEGIDVLNREVRDRGIDTVQAEVADVSKHIPIDSNMIDICLMATVLHDLIHDQTHEGTLVEVARVTKPDGRLAVVEFKKIEGPPGPPMGIRLSPQETEACLLPYGFTHVETVDVGPYNYLSVFQGSNG